LTNEDEQQTASMAKRDDDVNTRISGMERQSGKSPLLVSGVRVPREWREYVSGWGAATVNICITFPIHKTMFRQIVHGFSVPDALRQLRHEGALQLYRGILPPLLAKSTSTCLMFGTYSQYSRLLRDHAGFQNANKLYIQSTAAFLAGCTEAVLAPFERVQVILQDNSQHSSSYRNTAHALRQIRAVHGITEYYRGLTAVLARNGPSNIIFFASREKIRELLPKEGNLPYYSYLADFLCGSVTGAFISTIFYPINATRTHMQLVVGGKFISFRSVFKDLLHTRGLHGMFKGVHLNYSRSFLSWGIINVTYEFIHKRLVPFDLPTS